MIMYIAGNHNTHWMVRSFLSQPFGTKKAYLCHATGTEQSAQNLSISNSGGGQYMRWGTTPSPFYAYDVPYNVFT